MYVRNAKVKIHYYRHLLISFSWINYICPTLLKPLEFYCNFMVLLFFSFNNLLESSSCIVPRNSIVFLWYKVEFVRSFTFILHALVKLFHIVWDSIWQNEILFQYKGSSCVMLCR